MKELTTICPRCNSARTCLNGHSRDGNIRRKCLDCGYQYTQDKFWEIKKNTVCKICGETSQRIIKGLCLTHYRKWNKAKKFYPDITPEEAANIDRRYKHGQKNPIEIS